jgi:hypothetical protein
MSFTPTKEELQEAKTYIDKITDNYGVALRVKMLIEQAEKVERYEKALNDIDAIIDASHYSPSLHLIREVVCEVLNK